MENFVYAIEAEFSVRYCRNSVRMFALMISWTSLKMGHIKSKTRSAGQILKMKKSLVYTIEATFSVRYS